MSEVFVKCGYIDLAYVFSRKMNSLGWSWSDGEVFNPNHTEWKIYESETRYFITTDKEVMVGMRGDTEGFYEIGLSDILACRTAYDLRSLIIRNDRR